MDREFKTADCCLNCESRALGMRATHNGIECTVDGEIRSGRLICSLYKRSLRKDIRSGENKILNAVRRNVSA